ncbi:LPXTG cell wall anchor domain-containing protein, partial [Enterococcus faecalis]
KKELPKTGSEIMGGVLLSSGGLALVLGALVAFKKSK